MTLREIATELSKTLRCDCDFDKWEPERTTGHTCVCRIHNGAIQKMVKDGYNQKMDDR